MMVAKEKICNHRFLKRVQTNNPDFMVFECLKGLCRKILKIPREKKCKKCFGEVGQKSVGFEKDPEENSKIIGWNVFTFGCKECGHEFQVKKEEHRYI